MRIQGLPALAEVKHVWIPRRRKADIVARKKAYMKDAQQKWRFMTNFDCSTIKTEEQLSSMVGTRSGISDEQAERDVGAWMHGKRF